MAFMLGAFTGGLASGAENALSLYGKYQDIRSKQDTSDKLQKALDEQNQKATSTSAAGTAPGQATSTVQNAAPSLDADPRASKAGAALTALGEHSDRDTTVGPAPGTTPNAKSDAAMSAPAQGQSQAVNTTTATGVQGNPAGDSLPSATAPTQPANTAAPTTSQSPWMDWILGRNPQNRAVHLTSAMGVATGAGSSSTPMSTSPGGRPVGASVSDWASNGAPQYLPQGQNQPGQAAPQPSQPANVGARPAMANGAVQGAPTLASSGNPIQAIQTQYGSQFSGGAP